MRELDQKRTKNEAPFKVMVRTTLNSQKPTLKSLILIILISVILEGKIVSAGYGRCGGRGRGGVGVKGGGGGREEK
jgi:hypothetical protein